MTQAILAYGAKEWRVTLPAGIEWQLLERQEAAGPGEESVIASGLAGLQAEMATQGWRRRSRILLVVPDHTRRCRLERLLPSLADMLQKELAARLDVVVASGTHTAVAPETIAALVGGDFFSRFRVEQHDGCDPCQLEEIGVTRRGTPVVLSRKLRQADGVITVGGVRLHYFAGFGGGPKMIFPGLAGYDSVRANHFRSLDLEGGRLHPGCREGELDSNPVFQDLAEAALMPTVPVISWQLLLDSQGRLCHGETGSLLAAHRRICGIALEQQTLPLAAKADIVLASSGGFPADVDLIQSHKAMHHAFAAVKPGGWLILLAECSAGIGSATFMAYFSEATAAGIARRLREDYQLNGQTALALRQKTEAAHIVLVSGLAPELVAATGLIPAANLDEAWTIVARRAALPPLTGYVFPRAAFFSPRE